MSASVPPGGAFDPGSFRDPSSRVYSADGHVGRILSDDGLDDWKALAASNLFAEWTASGRLVETVEFEADGQTQLRHARIPFWSYPYEWSFTMLEEAARLHLDLLDAALAEGLTLKDATPYNVQFVGSRPVFIDIGSFRPLGDGEPWLGYRQFCQLFLYPLLVQAHAEVPFQPLLRGSLQGIEPDVARSILKGRGTFKPGILADVVLQARSVRTAEHRNVREELRESGFTADMIRTNVKRLRKVIDKTVWSPDSSQWSDYRSCSHVAEHQAQKEAFVRAATTKRRPLVWDLGANDGRYSRIAADNADVVVAIDSDALVADRLYRRLRDEGNDNILTLVMDLADPSPGLGWRGRERRRLEDRGQPDLVLMLALMHHLVVASNLPLTEVLTWAASLRSEIVFEWVPPDDPLVGELTANKLQREIHEDYHEDAMRKAVDELFTVVREEPVGNRTLLHLHPRS